METSPILDSLKIVFWMGIGFFMAGMFIVTGIMLMLWYFNIRIIW